MNTVVPVALAALLGVSLCAAGWSLLGVELFPGTKRSVMALTQSVQNFALWFTGALVAAVVVLIATGWPVVALWIFVAILSVPMLRSSGPDPEEEIRRVAAIATWAEQVRDTIAAAAGIQHALIVTAQRPPAAIATELDAFSYVANRDLAGALRKLRSDINHPSADLVIAGMLAAIELDAGKVSDLLERLAESIRAEAAMRQRIEVSRSRVRASWRIVATANAATVVVLMVFGRDITGAYSTVAGQLWLVLVVFIVSASLYSFRRLAAIPQPERFVSRERVAA